MHHAHTVSGADDVLVTGIPLHATATHTLYNSDARVIQLFSSDNHQRHVDGRVSHRSHALCRVRYRLPLLAVPLCSLDPLVSLRQAPLRSALLHFALTWRMHGDACPSVCSN